MYTLDMTTNVGQTLRKTSYKTARVGLELEYEKCRPSKIMSLGKWHTESDHSLREGGIEFVSMPLVPSAIDVAVEQMITQAVASDCKATQRCGLHVHVNCSHLTWQELYCFVVYYCLLEPTLFAEFAPGREMSHFCVPTWTNVALTEYMYYDGMMLKTGVPINWTSVNKNGCSLKDMLHMVATARYGNGNSGRLQMLATPKYGAMNVNSLKKFGTLEFRQAPSTLDAETIIRWTKLLLAIQTEAIKYNDATDIMLDYDANGLLTLCEAVGLETTKEVDELDQEDAVDTAAIIAGHIPVNWKDLKWEIK